MKDEKQKLIERIRKLLSRVPGAGATQAEAETALALARKLMDAHGLDAETVASHEGASEDWTTEAAWEGEGFCKAPEVTFIGPILCEFFHVRVFSTKSLPRSTVQIFGDRQRVEFARWVYAYLAGVFADLWLGHRVGTKCRKDRQRAFYVGIAAGITHRLRQEQREGMAAAPGGRALALIDDAVGRAFQAAYPAMPKARGGTFSDLKTIGAGMKAGAGVNIARPVEKGGPAALEGPKPRQLSRSDGQGRLF